jgi:serine protease Do
MIKHAACRAVLLLLLATRTLATEQPDWRAVAAKALPAVVEIEVERDTGISLDPFAGLRSDVTKKTRMQQTMTSGFVLRSNGIIVAPFVVAREASQLWVLTGAGTRYPATVLGSDEMLDLALLKIDANNLPALELVNSDSLQMGEPVAAIGSPFELGPSMSTGIVSAVQRSGAQPDAMPSIQTDVMINSGHAGSPLLNREGGVIGVISSIYTNNGYFAGISFATPASRIQAVLPRLLEGKSIQRPIIGLLGNDQWLPFDSSKSRQRRVIVVESVAPDLPAARAGLQSGDQILKFNGIALNGFQELSRLISDATPGQSYELVIDRDGKMLALQITPSLR